jgi:hypothetical protein
MLGNGTIGSWWRKVWPVARQSAGSLATAQQERACDRARRRQQMLTGGVAAGAVIALGIASLAPPVAPPVAPPSAVAAAPAEPAPPVMLAAAQPTILPDTTPTATAAEPAPSNAAAPLAPEPLDADETREVQKRLQAFGFNPGPADGVAGRLTADAALSYRQSRGQPQTGDIDRELLDQLRQDPAPQVAPPQRTAQRARAQARRSSPFDEFGRWLNSLVR